MRVVWAIARKELRLLMRDPFFVGLQLLLPTLLLLTVGFLFRVSPERIQLGVVDLDGSKRARRLGRSLNATRELDVIDLQASSTALSSGHLSSVLVLRRGAHGELEPQHLGDGAEPVVSRAAEGLLSAKLKAPSGRVTSSLWFNPEQRDELFFLPAVFAVVLFIVSLLLTSACIINERASGTWRSLACSPVSSEAIVAGKLLPYLLQAIVGGSLALTLAVVVFDLPVPRGLAEFVLVSLVFTVGSSALGLVISCVVANEARAWDLVRMVAVMPTFSISGFVFPVQAFPDLARRISSCYPPRYYIELCRYTFICDARPLEMRLHVLVITLYAVLMVLLAIHKVEALREAR